MNPHLWVYNCEAAFDRNDLLSVHILTVANFDLSLGTSNILLARYLLAMGKIADLVPLWVVVRSVAFAEFSLIQKKSNKDSAVICV